MMAEVPEPCSPFGYKDEFVNPVNEDMQCGICHLPMKEPMITRCGHHFCQECIKEHLQREEPHGFCPVDREAVDQYKDIFPNKDKERKILALAVRCGNEGCQWADELRLKEIHLGVCLFKEIPCPLCKVTMVRKDLDAHNSTQCPWRKLQCDHCQGQYPDCQMEKHLESCERYPVHCDHEGCKAIVSREMLQNHMDKYCKKTKLPCYFASLGCQKEVIRENLETHLLSTLKEHIHLFLQQIDLLKGSNLALEEKCKEIQKAFEAEIQQRERTLKILIDEKEHAQKVQMEEKEQAWNLQREENEHALKLLKEGQEQALKIQIEEKEQAMEGQKAVEAKIQQTERTVKIQMDEKGQLDKKEKCFVAIVVAILLILFCHCQELRAFNGKMDEKEQALNGKMNEEVRALNGKMDEKEQALNGKMDEEVRALNGKMDEKEQALNGKMDEEVRALNGKMDEKEQALNGKMNEEVRALNGKVDEKEQALNGKMDEEVQALKKILTSETTEELKRLMDEKEKALNGIMDERENYLISKEQALNEKIQAMHELVKTLDRMIDENKQTLRKELNNSFLISVGVAALSILICFGLKHISIPFN